MTTLPALGLIAGWAWYGRDTPREHPSVTPAELAEIGDDSTAQVDSDISAKRLLALLTNRNVLLLTISYVLMNYAFYLLSRKLELSVPGPGAPFPRCSRAAGWRSFRRLPPRSAPDQAGY